MAAKNLETPSNYPDLQILNEISQLLTVLDLDQVLNRVIKLSASAVGAMRSSLFLHDGTDIDWEHVIVTREMELDESVFVVQKVLDKGVAGWVNRHQEGTIVHDTKTDERWYTFPNDTNTARSALCVPFVHNNNVQAILTLLHDDPNHFSEYDLTLLTIIANQTSVAIHNALLFNHIQAQQLQLDAMFQSIPDVLLVVDTEGKILVVNEAATQFLSRTRNELVGQSLEKFTKVEPTLRRVLEVIARDDSGEEYQTFELHSDRTNRDFLVTTSPWEKPARIMTMSGYVIVMRDITTLRDLTRFKDDMLKLVSHDLRTPLSLIVGYCDLIGLDYPDKDVSLHTYLNIIRDSTSRMNGILDDLLRVEQLRSTPMDLLEVFDVRELVKGVYNDMLPVAQQKRHALTYNVDDNCVHEISGAPMLIREALGNLVSNAIKYTPQGDGKVEIRVYVEGEKLKFAVHDNGIGIPEKNLPYLFNSFYRAKQPGTETIEGTGLGLNLVKTVIERHGGQVWVESEQGVGSTFGFWLPLHKVMTPGDTQYEEPSPQ